MFSFYHKMCKANWLLVLVQESHNVYRGLMWLLLLFCLGFFLSHYPHNHKVAAIILSYSELKRTL